MNYRCITEISELKEYIEGNRVLAFDIETSPTAIYRTEDKAALDPFKSEITGISFSVKEKTGVYAPINHRTGTNAHKSEIINFMSEILTDKKIIKIAHNLSFESMFFYHLGIIIQEPCYDTIAASQLTLKNNTKFRTLGDSGLKTLVSALYTDKLPSFKQVTAGKYFDELNPQDTETIRYACADSDYALRLYHTFNDWFDRFLPKHRYLVEKVESPTSIYVGLMKHNGLLVDKDIMIKKQKEADNHLQKLKYDIAFITGDVAIGANASTVAFKNYLFHDLGLPVLKRTEKQRKALDDETIILLTIWCREHKPEFVHLLELIQEYRRWGKIKSTYIDGYLKHINSATNRIHPDLFPLGTETGRFASRNPNMQNMPRAGSDEIGIRRFITASKGKILLSLDFSQIELRVGAFYCRDEKMLETYKNGGDIHAQTTSVIYKMPFEEAVDKNAEHYKERRTIAKNCNFGTFFGLFPKGLQKTLKFKAALNTSITECEEIINNLKAGYPRLSSWQNEVKRKATIRHCAETYLGRRRYLPGITSVDWKKKSFAERCALNTPIQGTAADILKLALGRLINGLQERLWLKPLLQVHDELVFELPESKLDEAISFIKVCMEAKPFDEFDLLIIAEVSVGRNFGDMKELED